jgi:hypothetical protein
MDQTCAAKAGRVYFVDTTKAVPALPWGKESLSFSASFPWVATIITYYAQKIKKNGKIRKAKYIEIHQIACIFTKKMVKWSWKSQERIFIYGIFAIFGKHSHARG